MPRRMAAELTLFILLVAACGGSSLVPDASEVVGSEPAERVDETRSVPSTSPPDPTINPFPRPPPEPEAPVGQLVASLTLQNTVFELYDEGDGCLAVAVSSQELRPAVDRGCFNEFTALRETSQCGWLTTTSAEPRQECDVDVPIVLYGRITNQNIGFVCVGTIEDTDVDAGVTGARFIEPTAEGYMLEVAKPHESARAAHLFGVGGNRYGEPQLDAPSGYIYELCEERAPWGEAGNEYVVILNVYLAEALRRDDVTILLDGGLGTTGFSGGAFDDVPGWFRVQVPAPSTQMTVEFQLGDGLVSLLSHYSWPPAAIDLFTSGVPCTGAIYIDLLIDEIASDGVASGIELRFAGSDCD